MVDTVLAGHITDEETTAGADTRSMAAIEVKHLEVKAGTFALRVHNLTIPLGSRVAVIGANGSGKTTLVESVLGVRRAEKIEGSLLGIEINAWHRNVQHHRKLGVQFQRGLYPSHLTPRELISLHRSAFGSADPQVAESLQILEIGNVPFRGLSPGQRQRLMLYMALGHKPPLLVIDEPLSALDRMFTNIVVELLHAYKGTLVMVCHTATELDLADRILWIERGEIKRHLSLESAIAEARSALRPERKALLGIGADLPRIPEAEHRPTPKATSAEEPSQEALDDRISLLNQILRVCTRSHVS